MKVLDIDGLNYYDGKIKQTYATKTELNAKAPLASPALTGTPTSQTPLTDDNSTKIATTAYVKSNLGNYATLNGATFTGTVNGVTPTAGDDSTKLATTAYVQAELADYVTLNGLSTELGDYLPLAGGTMNGNIAWTKGEIGYRTTTHTAPHDPCRQMVVTAGTVDSEWIDGNAKLCLHTYDPTGVNTSENGSFVLQASDGTNAPFLEGSPDGKLKWNNKDVITSEMTGEIKRVSGNSSTANTTVTLCSISSHAAGNWLIVGHIDLNASINNSYNTVISVSGGARVVRGNGLNGGGQCNMWIKYLSENETVSLQGWIPSAATMRGTLEMIRLA